MTQFDAIGIDQTETDSAARARWRAMACDAVEAELDSDRLPCDRPAVALRGFGDGYLVVGIAGSVDRARAHRIGGLLGELRSRSLQELVLSFGRLGHWDPQLVRVIGQARIHHLIDGGRLELRDTPPQLAAALGPPQVDPAVRDSQVPAADGRTRRLPPWELRW